MLRVVDPGLQSTIQAAPFRRARHWGMPAGGAADCVSLAIANVAVGNAPDEAAVEMTLAGAAFLAEDACRIAVAGACGSFAVDGEAKPNGTAVDVSAGQHIAVPAAPSACRSYLACSPTFAIPELLGSRSTALAAGLGGIGGRALQRGDELAARDPVVSNSSITASQLLRYSNDLVLRATSGPEAEALGPAFFETRWQVTPRCSRMGAELVSDTVLTGADAGMPSAPVFPGTVQLPPSGRPFLLGCDVQTTGGYLRIAQVIRADRHLIGQIRPSSRVTFVPVSPARARDILIEKQALFARHLCAIEFW